MTLQGLLAADAARTASALKVMANPQDYKVCDQCYSVSKLEAKACPVCGVYRWRQRVKAVQAVCKIFLKRSDPFPLTSGVAPRII